MVRVEIINLINQESFVKNLNIYILPFLIQLHVSNYQYTRFFLNR